MNPCFKFHAIQILFHFFRQSSLSCDSFIIISRFSSFVNPFIRTKINLISASFLFIFYIFPAIYPKTQTLLFQISRHSCQNRTEKVLDFLKKRDIILI